jgi:hypothetical protein
MCLATYPRGDAPETGADDPRRGGLAHLTDGARHRSTLLGRLISSLLPSDEAVGKRFGGVDISNGDEERAQAIALRRHAEG